MTTTDRYHAERDAKGRWFIIDRIKGVALAISGQLDEQRAKAKAVELNEAGAR